MKEFTNWFIKTFSSDIYYITVNDDRIVIKRVDNLLAFGFYDLSKIIEKTRDLGLTGIMWDGSIIIEKY